MTRNEQSRPDGVEFERMIATAHRSIHREMRRGRRRLVRRALAGGLVALVVAGGGVAVAASQIDSPKSSVFPAGPATPPQRGEDVTIGPWRIGQPPPDLVPIDLEDGRSGYLRTYDMANGSQNPDFDRKRGSWTDTVLPVYAEDGQTVIGEFVGGSRK